MTDGSQWKTRWPSRNLFNSVIEKILQDKWSEGLWLWNRRHSPSDSLKVPGSIPGWSINISLAVIYWCCSWMIIVYQIWYNTIPYDNYVVFMIISYSFWLKMAYRKTKTWINNNNCTMRNWILFENVAIGLFRDAPLDIQEGGLGSLVWGLIFFFLNGLGG